jgi:hypothetical protein
MLTLDDFYERIIKPLADKGSFPHQVMIEVFEKTKNGEMTPSLARSYAELIIPK